MFAIDKKTGLPCPNLLPSGKCAIYNERHSLGFNGCIHYDCLGAGQRLTNYHREVGSSFLTTDALLSLFFKIYQTHELLLVLLQAFKLPIKAEDRIALKYFVAQMNKSHESLDWLKTLSDDCLQEKIRAFLRTLSKYLVHPKEHRHSPKTEVP